MASQIVVLSGGVSSGKSTLAGLLESRFRFYIIKTGNLLRSHLGVSEDAQLGRRELQETGERLDRATNGRWVSTALAEHLRQLEPDAFVLIDAVRIASQLDALREAFGSRVVHIHLRASLDELSIRYKRRSGTRIVEMSSYDEVRQNATGGAS